jgi:hypothetical protein
VERELGARLTEWMADTEDPLLHGPVPPPPGAECNEQDRVSAREPTRIAPLIGREAAARGRVGA